MKTNNKFMDPARADANREQFAREVDMRSQKQRNALFSMPLGLAVGDDSANYQTYRKEHYQVGQHQTSVAKPHFRQDGCFEKFKGNAVGDPFVEPNTYHLRKYANRDAGIRNHSVVDHAKPFGPQAGPRTVKHSEFEHKPNGPAKSRSPEPRRNFQTGKSPKEFSTINSIGYALDPYERKAALDREEYAKQNRRILDRNRPFGNTVKQKGCFYPDFATYGGQIIGPNKNQYGGKSLGTNGTGSGPFDAAAGALRANGQNGAGDTGKGLVDANGNPIGGYGLDSGATGPNGLGTGAGGAANAGPGGISSGYGLDSGAGPNGLGTGAGGAANTGPRGIGIGGRSNSLLRAPWRNGDPAHVGHNKTLGGHGRSSEDQYHEEMIDDYEKYYKTAKKPIWRDPTHDLTMMNSTIKNNF